MTGKTDLVDNPRAGREGRRVLSYGEHGVRTGLWSVFLFLRLAKLEHS